MPLLKFSTAFMLTAGFILPLFLISCYEPAPPKPPVSIEKMKKVILDLQLAETYSLGLGDSNQNRFLKNKDSLEVFYQSVFRHHRLSADSFLLAINWYKAHPSFTDSLFIETLNWLNEEKARLNIQSETGKTKESAKVTTDTTDLSRDSLIRIEKIRDSLAQMLQPATNLEAK